MLTEIQRTATRLALILIAIGAIGLAAAPAFAGPAADEYSLDLPDPGGESKLEPEAPTPDQSALPDAAQEKLGDSQTDQLLTQIGTAPELAAPAAEEADGGGKAGGADEPGVTPGDEFPTSASSLTTITVDGAQSGSGLLLAAALGAIGSVSLGWWVLRRRGSGDSRSQR